VDYAPTTLAGLFVYFGGAVLLAYAAAAAERLTPAAIRDA